MHLRDAESCRYACANEGDILGIDCQDVKEHLSHEIVSRRREVVAG